MTRPAIILDYAPPPRSLAARVWERLAGPRRAVHWFFMERRLRPIELVVGGWAIFTTSYVVLAAARIQPRDGVSLLLAISLVAITMAGFAYIDLVRKGAWAAAVLLALLAIATPFLAGMVQLERCPHATYLHVFGTITPIDGDPCNNPRDTRPWWMR